jgi:hypothetical protein
MAYKTCEDCGSKIGSYGCTWCNEDEYIEMQNYENEKYELMKDCIPDWTQD